MRTLGFGGFNSSHIKFKEIPKPLGGAGVAADELPRTRAAQAVVEKLATGVQQSISSSLTQSSNTCS